MPTSPTEGEDVSYSASLWRKKFYPIKNLDYRRLRLSAVGVYSITKPAFIDKILGIIRRKFKQRRPVITDATAGMGMISIVLAQEHRVNAVEMSEHHVGIIRNNMRVYGVSDNVRLVHADYTQVMLSLRQDILIIDPPWEQNDNTYYKEKAVIDLFLSGKNIIDVINELLDAQRVKLVILFAPYNYNLTDFFRLVHTTKISVHKIKDNKHYIVCVEMK